MKLFVDDLRPCPDGWVLAKTATEAISVLITGEVRELSLDHDLGEPESEVGSGYQVVCWLEERAHAGDWRHVPRVIAIHSANPVGHQRMQAAIDNIERLRAARKTLQVWELIAALEELDPDLRVVVPAGNDGYADARGVQQLQDDRVVVR